MEHLLISLYKKNFDDITWFDSCMPIGLGLFFCGFVNWFFLRYELKMFLS